MAFLARFGMWCIKKAVLHAMPKNGEKIRTVEISRKIGIYRDHKNHSGNDWCTQQALADLANDEKVEKDNHGNKSQHGWKLALKKRKKK